MMSDPERIRLITVFGGSGFLGRYVVKALTKRGHRVRVAVRRPELANMVQPLGGSGQIHVVQANLRSSESVKQALSGADGVVNLVGILQQTGRQTFKAVQSEGADTLAQAVKNAGIDSFVHVSALGADARSQSLYAQSKAFAEQAVLKAVPSAVIVRPSIIFGPGDSFFNRFATLARLLPVLPLAGAETLFQPVYAADVAEAVAQAIDGRVNTGQIYELGGPDIASLQNLVRQMLDIIGRKRLIVSLPAQIAKGQASIMELLDKLSLGLLPDELKLTRDQVILLQNDNIVSQQALQEGRDLSAFDIRPANIQSIVPSYLERFRKHGQFESRYS